MRFEINRPAEPQTAALVAQKHVSRGQYYHVAEKKNFFQIAKIFVPFSPDWLKH